MDLQEKLRIGPREGVEYPVSVTYCGNCTMPIEVTFLLFLVIISSFITEPSYVVLRKLSRVREVQEVARKVRSDRVREAGDKRLGRVDRSRSGREATEARWQGNDQSQ